MKVISYNIHEARVVAKKLRYESVPKLTEFNIQFELDIKNLDKDIIMGLISYTEYLDKYKELVDTMITKTGSDLYRNFPPNVQRVENKHLSYVHEFVEQKECLKKK